MKAKLKIGIIGCGAIGGFLAQGCQEKKLSEKLEVVGLFDIDKVKSETLAKKLNKKTAVLECDELIDKSDLNKYYLDEMYYYLS